MKNQTRLQVIFIISLFATLGSLYFGYFGDPMTNIASGEFFNPENALPVCVLCWYTRIALFPVLLLSGIGLLLKDQYIWRYILPLVGVGFIISLYQNIIIIVPKLTSGFCDSSNPCTIGYLDYFGFINIPLLALLALIMMLIMTLWGAKKSKHDEKK